MNRPQQQLKTKPWEKFETQADEIVQRFLTLRNTRAASPYEREKNYFKSDSYRLIRRTISSEGGHKIIKSIVRKWKCEPPFLFYEGNEFHFGLLAIDPEMDILSPQDLSLFARQMKYADIHGVEAHLLVGFLWQSGASVKVAKKLKDGYREPWFRS